MHKSLVVALLAGSLLAAPMAANASLIGQSISGTLATNQAPVSTQFVSPAVVGAGPEFFGSFTDVFEQAWDFTVDVGADTITVGILSSSRPDGGNVGSSPLVDISLTGFTGLGTMNLQSYTCDVSGNACGAQGFGPTVSRLASDANSFNVGFDIIRTGETYVFGPSLDNGGVPEPATWALMLGGFGLAGAALRARRRAVAAA